MKRAIATEVDGIKYVSPLVWYILDTNNQGDLVKWLAMWGEMDFHFTMGKFWFDSINDFEDWMQKIGATHNVDSAEFSRLVDNWRV